MPPKKIIHQTPPEPPKQVSNLKPNIMLGKLHKIRLKKFKDYVNANISEPKLKKILIDFSNMPKLIFLGKIREIITPYKENLADFLKKMCAESEIDFTQFKQVVVDTIIRFLSYFIVSKEFLDRKKTKRN